VPLTPRDIRDGESQGLAGGWERSSSATSPGSDAEELRNGLALEAHEELADLLCRFVLIRRAVG
jgi:hypothetical protein